MPLGSVSRHSRSQSTRGHAADVSHDRLVSLSVVNYGKERKDNKPQIRGLECRRNENLHTLRTRVKINTIISQKRDAVQEDMVMFISELWGKKLYDRVYYGTELDKLRDKLSRNHFRHNVIHPTPTENSIDEKKTNDSIVGNNKEQLISKIDIPFPNNFEPIMHNDYYEVSPSAKRSPSLKNIVIDLNEDKNHRDSVTQQITNLNQSKNPISIRYHHSPLQSIRRPSHTYKPPTYLETPRTALQTASRASTSTNLAKPRHASQPSPHTRHIKPHTRDDLSRDSIFKLSRSTSTARLDGRQFMLQSRSKVDRILSVDHGRPRGRRLTAEKMNKGLESKFSVKLRQLGYRPDTEGYDIDTVHSMLRNKRETHIRNRKEVLYRLKCLMDPQIKASKV